MHHGTFVAKYPYIPWGATFFEIYPKQKKSPITTIVVCLSFVRFAKKMISQSPSDMVADYRPNFSPTRHFLQFGSGALAASEHRYMQCSPKKAM